MNWVLLPFYALVSAALEFDGGDHLWTPIFFDVNFLVEAIAHALAECIYAGV